MAWKNNYSLFFVSIIIVTGPSFIKETFISAPNSPEYTCFPIAMDKSSLNSSYKGIACSALAAFIYDGLFPF